MTAVGSASSSRDRKNELGFVGSTVCMMILQQHRPGFFLQAFTRLSAYNLYYDSLVLSIIVFIGIFIPTASHGTSCTNAPRGTGGICDLVTNPLCGGGGSRDVLPAQNWGWETRAEKKINFNTARNQTAAAVRPSHTPVCHGGPLSHPKFTDVSSFESLTS